MGQPRPLFHLFCLFVQIFLVACRYFASTKIPKTTFEKKISVCNPCPWGQEVTEQTDNSSLVRLLFWIQLRLARLCGSFCFLKCPQNEKKTFHCRSLYFEFNFMAVKFNQSMLSLPHQSQENSTNLIGNNLNGNKG